MEDLGLLSFLCLWLLFAILIAIWAGKIGRNVFLAILGSILFSPLVVAIYYLIVGDANKCPYCKSGIPSDAIVCKHCGRTIS